MSDFVKYLKKRSSNDDKMCFNRWVDREISTEEAIEIFKQNNRMKDVIINSTDFIIWLSTLGYRRNYREE